MPLDPGFALQTSINTFLATLDSVQASIAESMDVKRSLAQTQQDVELSTTLSQKGVYDSKFLEEKFPNQAPKRRRQTLQEFVLLFFYISFAIFSVALMIYAFLENGQSYSAAGKTMGLCCIIALAISGILIKVG